MKFRKEFLLFSLVSIIFLAGCTSSSSTGSGVGLTIQSFTASPASVDAGTNVLLTLQVQNTGESDATGVTAELIGLPYTISDRIKQVGTGTVIRADPQLGLPQGEQQVVLWDIATTARDTTASYEAKARVTYNYVTSSENVIRIVSSDYYRTLSSTDQQALKRGVISSQYTKGPLTVTIITPQPVVQRGTVALPVQIQIDNIGSGRTFLNSVAVANLDKVSVDAPGLNCPTTEVRLVQGKTGRITCQPGITVTDVTELSYKIILRYKYFADSTTTFSVVKSLGVTPTTGSLPAPLGGNGQQCRTTSPQCDSGLVCSNNICVGSGTVPTGGLGQVCRTTSPQCDTGMTCSNNFCVQVSGGGIPPSGTTGGTPVTGGGTTTSDFSRVAPGAGNTCPQGYLFKDFLNQCVTSIESLQAQGCESQLVNGVRDQWNWADHSCFSPSSTQTTIPSSPGAPVRSLQTINGADASGYIVGIPTTSTSATIGLTTNKVATCRYNQTSSQLTYNNMLTMSSTGSTIHSQIVTGIVTGKSVYNVMCSDGTNTNTDNFIIQFNR